MDFKVKLLIGLGGAGATGGMGIAAYPYFSNKEKEAILTIITRQGERFILSTAGADHDVQWTSIKDSIKNDVTAKKEIGNRK